MKCPEFSIARCWKFVDNLHENARIFYDQRFNYKAGQEVGSKNL